MKHRSAPLLLAALLALSAFPQQADAIPAFARTYNISCATCHSVAPKLKDYGDEFAGNGFKLPDAPEPIRTYVDAGDDDMLLHRFFPLAIRFDGYVQWAERERGKIDFQLPYGMKIMSGGAISQHVGYYLYFYLSERGEIAGLEDAIIHFNDVFGSDLNVILGQFQVSDPLFKRELRLSLEDYELYKMRPASSHANLTYDRGVMLDYGFDFGLDLVAIAVNGNGVGPAQQRIFDIDNGKAFAFRASQSIGPLRIGGFAYLGDEKVNAAENRITIFGPDLTIGNDYLELNAQYLLRKDDAIPTFDGNTTLLRESNMNGLMLELVYLPEADKSKWAFVALYNRVENELTEEMYHTATIGASRVLARNLRLVGELTYDIEYEKPRLSFGFVSAF